MKSFIVFALIAAVAFAAPPAYNGEDRQAETRVYENNVDVYRYDTKLETTNGIKSNSEGQLTNAGTENEAFVTRGSYSYTGPDGVVYTVNWVADQNGFQPQGAHLPQ